MRSGLVMSGVRSGAVMSSDVIVRCEKWCEKWSCDELGCDKL